MHLNENSEFRGFCAGKRLRGQPYNEKKDYCLYTMSSLEVASGVVQSKSSNLATYPVVETFHSIQGEGAFTGSNAFFIRLGGCDVGCWFCDTKNSWNAQRHPQMTEIELGAIAHLAQPEIVVITGGEPLMHNLSPLTEQLHHQGLRVHLETSGAYLLSGEFDWITLSPKLNKPPIPSLYPHISELKVVIANASDLAWAEYHASQVSPLAVKYLQPEWSTPDSSTLVFDYILQHSDWRLSLQTHKFLGVK
jgi:organic radical activating enzyme